MVNILKLNLVNALNLSNVVSIQLSWCYYGRQFILEGPCAHVLIEASSRLGRLRRLRNDISMQTANIVYKSYIYYNYQNYNYLLQLLITIPISDYCDTIWNCCNVEDEKKLEKIQRRVATVIMKVWRSHDALNDLRYETLKKRKERLFLK